MQTVIMLDSVQNRNIFCLVDGDLQYFHGLYVGTKVMREDHWSSDEDHHRLIERLADVLFDEDDKLKVREITREEAVAAVRDGAELIVCGCVGFDI